LHFFPEGLAAAGFVQAVEQGLVGAQLFVVGPDHGQLKAAEVHAGKRVVGAWAFVHVHDQAVLAAGEVDVNLGQELSIEQGAVQGAA